MKESGGYELSNAGGEIEAMRAANVLPLTRRVPSRSHSATQRVALKRGAEAPGHRTARGRVLRSS